VSRLGFTRGQVVGLALAFPLLGYGFRGVLVDAGQTHPAELGRWLVGSAILHDALLVPLVLLVSVAVARLSPSWARPPALWALATSAILAVYAFPFVRGYGRNPSVPSLLARDYVAGLAAYVAVVLVVAVAWALVRRRSAGGRGDGLAAPVDADPRPAHPVEA